MFKKYLYTVLTAGVLTVLGYTSAQATIVGSKHDLVANPDVTVTGTTELCVFCHTPHNTGAGGGPVWNRAAPAGPFTMYSSATIDNVIAAAPNGISAACLSCHDGVTAFDALVNLPAGASVLEANMSAVNGGAKVIGNDLSNDHPVSITYGGLDPEFVAAVSGKVDILPLFGSSADQVECATCHNPHDPTNGRFLRKSQSSSGLCLTCHTK